MKKKGARELLNTVLPLFSSLSDSTWQSAFPISCIYSKLTSLNIFIACTYQMKMTGFVDLSYTTNDQSEPLNSIYSVVTYSLLFIYMYQGL